MAIAQAAQTPNADVDRHGDRGDRQREQDRRARVRVGERQEIGAEALAERFGRDDRERRDEKQTRERRASAPISPTRSATGSRRGEGAALVEPARVRHGRSSAGEGLETVDGEQHDEGDHQHDRGDGGRAGVVVFLELLDDEQRRDLGDADQIAGDEDDRAVFADRRARKRAPRR